MNKSSFWKTNFPILLPLSASLVAIRLTLSAYLWYLNGHTTDDWNYLATSRYIYDNQDWLYSIDSRPYSTLILAFCHALFPGRFQVLHYFHIVMGCLIGILFFALIWRLFPKQGWFAYLAAVVYLVYFPKDDESLVSWMVMGNWGVLLLAISLLIFQEFYLAERRSWLLTIGLGISLLFGYVASRIYEGTFFMVMPYFVAVLLAAPPRSHYQYGVVGSWLVIAMIAFIQFILPYLTGSQTTTLYQQRYETVESLPELIELSLAYVIVGLPIREIIDELSYPLLLISLMAAFPLFMGVGIVYQNRKEWFTNPTFIFLGFAIILGIAGIPLGDSGYIYAKFEVGRRSLYYGSFAQAIIVTALLFLIAYVIQSILKIRPVFSITALVIMLVMTSASWFFESHKSFWGIIPGFDDELIYIEDLLSIVPNLEDDTLLLLDPCIINSTKNPWNQTYERRYMPYLYGETADTGIQMVEMGTLPFEQDGMLVPNDYSIYTRGRLPFDDKFYRYDQMVIIGCYDRLLTVVYPFPSDTYSSSGDHFDTYNPYARISNWSLRDWRGTLIHRAGFGE